MIVKAMKMSFDSSIVNKMTEKQFIDKHISNNIISSDVKKREQGLKELYKLAKDIEDKAKAKSEKESKITKDTQEAK